MSLIQDVPSAPQTPEQKAELVKNQITASVNLIFRSMRNAYEQNMRAVWANAQGLSPQQVLDAFGADAGELFRLAGIVKEAVNGAKPGVITSGVPAGIQVAINDDGTVTITAAP